MAKGQQWLGERAHARWPWLLTARSPGRLTPISAADCGPAAGPAHAAASGDRRRSALLHRETAAAPPCCLWQPDGTRSSGSSRLAQREWWPWRCGKQDATTEPRCIGATCGAPAEHSASYQVLALSRPPAAGLYAPGNRSCCHWGKAPGECPWA